MPLLVWPEEGSLDWNDLFENNVQQAMDAVDALANTAATDADITAALAGVTAEIAAAGVTDRDRANHTGTQNAETITATGVKDVMLITERTKLAGIATGATANSTDASLRDRSTHTGVQASATISDLTEAVQDIVGTFLAAGTSIALTYDDVGNVLTVDAVATPGGTNNEEVRDVIGVALQGTGLITVTASDALDTITVATSATANDTNANLRDRSTHTNTQSADTITASATKDTFLLTERTKLTGIATAATANASDASLRDRTTHTGAQAISTVTGLQTALDAKATPADITTAITAERLYTLSGGAAKTASYTLVLGDAGIAVDFNGGSAQILTVPLNSSVAFPIGTQILVTWLGVGAVSVIGATTGVTINGVTTSIAMRARYTTAILRKTATDAWYLAGIA